MLQKEQHMRLLCDSDYSVERTSKHYIETVHYTLRRHDLINVLYFMQVLILSAAIKRVVVPSFKLSTISRRAFLVVADNI